jgi:hypothetical protein
MKNATIQVWTSHRCCKEQAKHEFLVDRDIGRVNGHLACIIHVEF